MLKKIECQLSGVSYHGSAISLSPAQFDVKQKLRVDSEAKGHKGL